MDMISFNIKNNSMTTEEVIAREIDKWLRSETREMMLVGERYYSGDHDILYSKRTVIGEGGKVMEVDNLPNSQIVDNQYARVVDQKANYSVGKPLTIKHENKNYRDSVKGVLDEDFMKKTRILTVNALNTSIGWLYVYLDKEGKREFKVFPSSEILPFWKDAEQTELDFVVRVYGDAVYEGREEKNKTRVEIYREDGLYRFDYELGEFNNPMLFESSDLNPYTPYITRRIVEDEEETVEAYSWGKIPLIPFKYNNRGISLISRVKSIQDNLNTVTSNFVNNLLEDPRNSIMVLKNYDGEDLGEFRRNLATYGAVKVRSGEGEHGGVDVLSVDVNSENYKTILRQLKTSLIENARGVDTKDDRLSAGKVNEMNIQTMYDDIDLDASGMEREFQTSLQELMYFVDMFLKKQGVSIPKENDKIEFQFNRDMLMNESAKIEDFVKSYGRISDETAVANHPWVSDLDKEMEKMKQDQSEMDGFINSLGKVTDRAEYNDGKQDIRKDEIKAKNQNGIDTRGE